MISVIIPTRNRCVDLGLTLDALGQQKDAPEFEVIVIDNASTDGTSTVLAVRTDPFPLHVLHEPVPHRGKARNRGLAHASGSTIVFIDDDVLTPPHFLATHAALQIDETTTVAGPIINIATPQDRPLPSRLNMSRAFFCTCNASVSRSALAAVGGFDEQFDRYGWEDTELGVRLREAGIRRRFSFDAYVHHIKRPQRESLLAESRRFVEKARMARRFVDKHPSTRVRLATGAYTVNALRAALFAPQLLMPLAAAVAEDETLPATMRQFARSRFLDGLYARELGRTREEAPVSPRE